MALFHKYLALLVVSDFGVACAVTGTDTVARLVCVCGGRPGVTTLLGVLRHTFM